MKLDLILENVRNRYSLGLLEESSELSEKQLLQGKILINESTMAIRTMLVENGAMSAVHNYLEEAWTDAVLQAADDTYEGAAEGVDKVAGGAQGLGHGLAMTGGMTAAYPTGVPYKEVPGFVGQLTKDGYERGYNPEAPSVVDTAQAAYKGANTAQFINENPGKSALIGLGGLTAAGAGLAAAGAVGKGTRDVARKVSPYVKSAGRDIRAAWKR